MGRSVHQIEASSAAGGRPKLKHMSLHRRALLTHLAVAAASLPAPFTQQVKRINSAGIRVAGIRMIPVRGSKYKVWTKRVGSGRTKLLTLHGGPGMSHEYLEALESFLPDNGIELYYYDQLGCNNSDRPSDPRLWTLAGYLEELEEVREGLGFDQFVLFGHSWGGILAIEYALKYARHLRAMVISNMSAGMRSYMNRIAWWKQQLPASVQKQVDRFDALGDYSSLEYETLMLRKSTHVWSAGCSRGPSLLSDPCGISMSRSTGRCRAEASSS